MLNELAKEIHENAKDKGFYDDSKNIGEMLCLIHAEVSEALEADRTRAYAKLDTPQLNVLEGWVSDIDFQKHFKDQVKGSFEEELADIIIRVLDLSAYKGIDIERYIKLKMRYNSMRRYKHGKDY